MSPRALSAAFLLIAPQLIVMCGVVLSEVQDFALLVELCEVSFDFSSLLMSPGLGIFSRTLLAQDANNKTFLADEQ